MLRVYCYTLNHSYQQFNKRLYTWDGRQVMLRLFKALCMQLLNILSDEAIFLESTNGFRYNEARCPCCGARGKLVPYGSYWRNLVSYECNEVVARCISPLRFECSSCNTTHALLPDILTPYSQHSLRFKLTVLVAYFEKRSTVVELCEQFHIAVSTLYVWKKNLLEHKTLILGVLASLKKPGITFVQNLLRSDRISEWLDNFYQLYNFSFLQNHPIKTTHTHPP